ncbi:MAG: 2-amino-4-hydroxy-6-hydroxymethyldihydropteridine diphosphokinase [Thermomonas sp.]
MSDALPGNFTLTSFPKAYLSLGSNIDAAVNLGSAISALRTRFGGMTLSQAYVFPAVGFDGCDFLNAAAIIDSDLDPHALNDWLHALEDAHGRDRGGPRYGNRTLDIDIVFYDDLVLEGPGHLQIPRDELQHAFVLKPLAEIAPDYVDPRSEKALHELWRTHPDHAIEHVSVALD